MPETQWPRYHVFVQEELDGPPEDAGSVHATDAEMALMNARDVFARRPSCVSMWVVPVDAIASRTIQQVENPRIPAPGPGLATDREPYYVACKQKRAGTLAVLGSVYAASAEQALGLAIEQFSEGRTPLVWWVFPVRCVVESDPADVESLFAPAMDKVFRMSTDFHTLSAMRRMARDE